MLYTTLMWSIRWGDSSRVIDNAMIYFFHRAMLFLQLRAKRTSKISEWQWRKQLRYYDEKGKVIVRMSDASFNYTYEYQVTVTAFVLTPSTYLHIRNPCLMWYAGQCAEVGAHSADRQVLLDPNSGPPLHITLNMKLLTLNYLLSYQGMHMGFGGNPYGPAGESVDLSVVTWHSVTIRRPRCPFLIRYG